MQKIQYNESFRNISVLPTWSCFFFFFSFVIFFFPFFLFFFFFYTNHPIELQIMQKKFKIFDEVRS